VKIATHIARILLGLVFLVFGLNGIHPFMPQGPMPTGLAGQFLGALMQSHYFFAVGAFMVVSGALFLVNLYVPLALALIAPVIVNILVFHITMSPGGIVPGIIMAILWIVVAYSVRSAFAGLFQKRVQG